jgi:16S rRNA (cytosine1402-N4)-methyltransferase
MRIHQPVLLKETIDFLEVKENRNYVDCTFGEGGHALEILKRNGPRGKVLGIERDPIILKETKKRKRLILVNDSFANLKKIVERENFKNVFGVLFDLGFSSWHLERSGRGFSFLRDEPLIMRYDGKEGLTAKEILNSWPEKEIEKIFREYGQERFAKRIAKEISVYRKLKSIKKTSQLVEIVKRATPVWYQKRKIHFATKVFQALRIAVNEELSNLEKALPQALEILEKGGRLVVISYHSLEDKIVKKFFKENFKKGHLKILTKKPLRPQKEEIKVNPRSRSAKLRAAIKI